VEEVLEKGLAPDLDPKSPRRGAGQLARVAAILHAFPILTGSHFVIRLSLCPLLVIKFSSDKG